MTVHRRILALLLTLAAVAVPSGVGARVSTPNVVASRYDVALDLRTDGSVDVVEQITVSVGDTPITWFERRVPGRYTDGLTNVVALVDGHETGAIQNGAGVRLKLGDKNISAHWQFAPLARGTKTFELRYRALHVVSRELAGPRFIWHALPTERTYPIDAARVTLRAPDGTLAVAMKADGGEMHSGTSWTDGLRVTRDGLGANDGITLDVTFSLDTFRPAEPAWAVAADHAQRLMPAFVSAAVTLLVVGAGTLIMIRIRTSRSRDGAHVAKRADEADDAAPAVAAALLNRGVPSWLALQAAFFRLVRDGRVVVEKTRDKTFVRGPAFAVRRGTIGSVTPHEQWIIEHIAAEGGDVDLRRLMTKMTRRQSGFRRALDDELLTQGLLDADRRSTARGLRTAGFVLLCVATISALVLGVFFIDSLGPALLTIPAALFADAFMFFLGGEALSRLSDAGENAAVQWRLRVAELRQVIKQPGAARSLSEFERGLPLAIGAGLGGRWLKKFEAQLSAEGADIAWLKAMGSAADVQASLAVMVAISGASHGGGAGGGAAGGGGSSSAG